MEKVNKIFGNGQECGCGKCFCMCCPCSCRGEKGDRGERGDRGEPGLQGEKGEQGDKGANGARGERGDKGERGESGEIGFEGLQGLQGERGESGAKGEQGDAGAKGEQGDVGPKGEEGYMGIEGEAGINLFAYYYAPQQIVAQDGKAEWIEAIARGPFGLTSDSTEIRINRNGNYFIESAWSATDDGALSLALCINGVKIPFMSYVTGTAREGLTCVMTGSIILRLVQGDMLSIVNYGLDCTLAEPQNNTPEGAPSNAAATVTIIKLGG